ncbi:hypothetical protein D3C76_685430 [compost metagenome]
MTKHVLIKDRHKVAGIELKFDPTVQKHFLNRPLPPNQRRGLLLSASKNPFKLPHRSVTPKSSQEPVCADFAI